MTIYLCSGWVVNAGCGGWQARGHARCAPTLSPLPPPAFLCGPPRLPLLQVLLASEVLPAVALMEGDDAVRVELAAVFGCLGRDAEAQGDV